MSNSASQGLYSPLPQSISDTDSEEELHSALPSKQNDKKKIINGGDIKDYHHLGDDGEDGHINGFPNLNNHSMDDVPMIKDGYKQPMTTIRKFCFVSSILLCFLIIIVFLWLLPCSDDATCARTIPKHHSSSWEKTFHGIELMGPINTVNGLHGQKNLVFLFRSDVTNPNAKSDKINIPSKSGGAISILGGNGDIAWYVPRYRIPTHLACDLLDVDNNGEKDCIITGVSGLFETINPISGQIIWAIHIHPKNSSLFTSIDFPLILPDLNNDRVNDLLTSCSLSESNHNHLIIVSGRNGQVLGKPYTVQNCESVHNLKLERNGITYSCINGKEGQRPFLSLNDLYQETLNKSYTPTQFNPNIKQYTKGNVRSNERSSFYFNGRSLIVNNQGHCPGNCNVNVQLIDHKNLKNDVSWSYNGTNMYGMVPTELNFKNNKNNLNLLQGHINGYILKFWQWNENNKNKVYTPNYILKKDKRNIFDTTEIKSSWFSPNIPRKKRSLLLDKTKNNYTVQLLTERLVLITYNTTRFNTVNASQSDICQLCLSPNNCQPDLEAQENSVLLDDLDQDGSQELISYLSTFIIMEDATDENDKYQLQSTIKVIRLEQELPKLYESVTKY